MSRVPPQPAAPSASGPPRAPMLDGYRAPAGRFDELGDASTAGPWQPLVHRLGELGDEGMRLAWKRGQDLLRENGIAHNLLAGEGEGTRRWELDPIPLVLAESEWRQLARGVSQRARLWNLVLADCYGPRQLLERRLLPPSILFSQSDYLRPLRHVPGPRQPPLTLYAADLARGPDGRWTVLADRTEAPNGTGFALENRVVLNNVFPELTRRLNLLRLAEYFQKLRERLFALAPSAIDDPSVVMLSPGPGDSTYFEDAYLSRYLGITLAVGEELTVRHDRLYLKTISGLRRVHVLLRRIGELDTDPLETPSSASGGVPGLFQAMRSGSVTVVNPPGSGIAEAPAFLPFLPAIARELLGEELALPSIDTWWTGVGPPSPDFTPEPWVVKNAFTRRLSPPLITRLLDPGASDELQRALERSPESHVVQREMPFSQAPAWNEGRLEPRSVAIRLFAFHDGEDFQVMPGGLVRSASDAEALPGLSLRENSCSKDLWILSTKPRPAISVSNLKSRQRVRRATGTLSSRAADNMLWIGRYSERAECATRLLLELVQCLTVESVAHTPPAVPTLLRTLAALDYLPTDLDPAAPGDRDALATALLPLFFDAPGAPGTGVDTIPANLDRLRSLAALSRDRLSHETWRIIGSLDELREQPRPSTLPALRAVLQQGLLLHSAFNGTSRENLTRTPGWRFLNIGRKFERSAWLVTLSDELLKEDPATCGPLLESALAINDCTLTYRFRYHGSPQRLPTLDLLLFDPDNPRGLRFQLHELDRDLSALPRRGDDRPQRPPHRTILRALHFLQTEWLEPEDDAAEVVALDRLHAYLAQLRNDLPGAAEQLGWEFFTHTTFTRS